MNINSIGANRLDQAKNERLDCKSNNPQPTQNEALNQDSVSSTPNDYLKKTDVGNETTAPMDNNQLQEWFSKLMQLMQELLNYFKSAGGQQTPSVQEQGPNTPSSVPEASGEALKPSEGGTSVPKEASGSEPSEPVIQPPENGASELETPATTETTPTATPDIQSYQPNYTDSATKIQFNNMKSYDIALVATPNAGQPNIDEPIIIPAHSKAEIDISKLTGTDTWSGNFDIRAAETMEPTGALLEYNFNANWGTPENVQFFDLSYINGVPYNSEQKDFINTVAYMPNGIVQGNQNGDLNDYLGSHWNELYNGTEMQKPRQNGQALNDLDGGNLNQMADLLQSYRDQTASAFYLYVGTEASNFADDQFSQGWPGSDKGMNIVFY